MDCVKRKDFSFEEKKVLISEINKGLRKTDIAKNMELHNLFYPHFER